MRDAAVVARDAAIAATDAPVIADVDAALPRAPMPVFDDWHLQAISTDGTTALVAHYDRYKTAPHYQVITIDTGAVEADLELTELFEMSGKVRTEGVARDLRRARTYFKRFPLGTGGEIASSPDGEQGAFNVVDTLYIVSGDFSPQGYGAPYLFPGAGATNGVDVDSTITSDGRTVVFTSTRSGGAGGADLYLVDRVCE